MQHVLPCAVCCCSEEYPDYVNAFNDVFALVVDGVNVATLPGTNTVVSINTVNADVNAQYFVANYMLNPPQPTVANGYTVLLNTKLVPVKAGQTLRLKLAVADALDRNLDSWVLISGSSLTVAPPTPSGCNISKPCCNADGTLKNGTTCRYEGVGVP